MTGTKKHLPVIPVWIIVSVAAFLIMSAVPKAHAESAGNLAAFLERIEKKAAEVKSFTSRFIQKKNLLVFSRPVIFYGRLVMEKPARLRWEFTAPIASVLILANNKGIKCQDDSRQVFDLDSDPAMQMVTRQMWAWMSGDYSKLRDTYQLKMTGENTLLLTPTQSGVAGVIDSIRLRFAEPDLHPEEVLITESGGDTTRISFSQYRINPALPENIFSDCLIDAE